MTNLAEKNVLIYISEMWYCGHDFYGEVMYQSLKEGKKVHILKCSGAVKATCTMMDPICHDKSWNGCENCMNSFNQMVRDYKIPEENIILFDSFETISIPPIPHFANVLYLDSWQYEGIDLGAAVYNTLANISYDHYLDTQENEKKIHVLLEQGIQLYHFLKQHFVSYSQIYFFSGRVTLNRVAVRICQQNSISFTSLEYGKNNKIVFYKNAYPHDVDYLNNRMQSLWESAPEGKIAIGESFFIQRREGTQTYDFTVLQKANHVPTVNPANVNVAIYDSSLIEMAGFPGFEANIHFLHYIYLIAKEMSSDKKFCFYLRAHPTRAKDETATGINFAPSTQAKILRILKFLNLENLKIILPHSSISSYALMDVCDIVLSGGSTMAMEATFWGKPCIDLGNSVYRFNSVKYLPKSHAELIDLLQTDNLAPKNKTSVLPFGYYYQVEGEILQKPNDWTWLPTPLMEKYTANLNTIKQSIKSKIKQMIKVQVDTQTVDSENVSFDMSEADQFYAQKPRQEELDSFFAYCEQIKQNSFEKVYKL